MIIWWRACAFVAVVSAFVAGTVALLAPEAPRVSYETLLRVLCWVAGALMLGWAALLGWGVWAGRLPLWTLGAAVAINLLTFVTYAMDKGAAQSGRWRTPEKHLHLLSLAGGWPGAWCAQQWLRHKSSKQEFRTVYWATVVLHCAALAAWVGGWLR